MVAGAATRPEDTRPLTDVGLYTPWDAARYLHVPGWFVGDSVGSPADDPTPGEAADVRLSFRELATLFVRAAAFDLPSEYRPRTGGVGCDRDGDIDFRRPAAELADGLVAGCPPLPQPHLGRLREFFVRRLHAVELASGEPLRLYPPTRSPSDGSPRLIVIDPRIRFGRPTVARTGTPTDVLFERYRAGDSVAALAEDYDLTTDEVEEAIRYEVTPPLAPTRNPAR